LKSVKPLKKAAVNARKRESVFNEISSKVETP
jgi:hypothetical protein